MPWASDAGVLQQIGENRERISEAVAQALDTGLGLPDEIVVLLLDGAEPLAAAWLRRCGVEPQTEVTVAAIPLQLLRGLQELGRDAADERPPEHGFVRVLLSNGSAPVLAHAQYATAANLDRWQRRLTNHIEGALQRIASAHGGRAADGTDDGTSN